MEQKQDTRSFVERFCINLTQLASKGSLDPVIGRHEEIRRVIHILSRRTKNNPVLIGEPGVGKTAIVEGIAQRIVHNDVPEALRNNTIYSLDLGLLVAGAKYQGEFEERLKGLLKELQEKQDSSILFIDELHILIGAGQTSGAMDASNLLKPALARGELHCIGATTLAEYKKYIEKDAALERRFQQVLVDEPSPDDALSILRGIKEKYELHHGIRIKDQALVEAVSLATKHIADRFLPDKAIDLIDEAAAMVRMSIDSKPEVLDRLERKRAQLEIERVALAKEKNDPVAQQRLSEVTTELDRVKHEHEALLQQWKKEKEPIEKISRLKERIDEAEHLYRIAEREGNFARASEIKYGTMVKLGNELEVAQKELHANSNGLVKEQVDETDVAKVLSRWTGIPTQKLMQSEKEKLLHMQEILSKRVIGQAEALKVVSEAIIQHRAGLANPQRPIGSFLFLGPTGVGKTEVARTVADFLFDDQNKMIRIDMSEYMERHAVARLIGAPPGYVGYEEGGQLTQALRRYPYSVILFDEIEKAHADVFNILLQMLDEGHLTDSQGRTVSCKNSIIIMTSNIGSDIIMDAGSVTATVREQVERRLQQTFRPELLNRIDAIVYFNPLTLEMVEQIAHRQVQLIIERLAHQHKKLEVDQSVYSALAQWGYQPEFGARPLQRAINQYLVNPLARLLLQHPEIHGVRAVVEGKGDNQKLVLAVDNHS